MKSLPRNLRMVFAFVGDSTMTSFFPELFGILFLEMDLLVDSFKSLNYDIIFDSLLPQEIKHATSQRISECQGEGPIFGHRRNAHDQRPARRTPPTPRCGTCRVREFR